MHSVPIAFVCEAHLVPFSLYCWITLIVRIGNIVHLQEVFGSHRWLLFQMLQHIRQQNKLHVFLRVQLSSLFLGQRINLLLDFIS